VSDLEIGIEISPELDDDESNESDRIDLTKQLLIKRQQGLIYGKKPNYLHPNYPNAVIHKNEFKIKKIFNKIQGKKKLSNPRTDIQASDSQSKVYLTTSNSSSSRDITSVKSVTNGEGIRQREISENFKTKEVMFNEPGGQVVSGSGVCKLPLRKTNTQNY
jgi:hypothetical protein